MAVPESSHARSPSSLPPPHLPTCPALPCRRLLQTLPRSYVRFLDKHGELTGRARGQCRTGRRAGDGAMHAVVSSSLLRLHSLRSARQRSTPPLTYAPSQPARPPTSTPQSGR